MPNDPTTGRTTPSLFQRLINRNFPESVKRAQLIWASWALIGESALLCLGIFIRAVWKGEVGMSVVYAFAASTVPLAAMAGLAYIIRKDSTLPGLPPGPIAPPTGKEEQP